MVNAGNGKKERIGRLLKMHANKREEIKEALAGDIVAAVGLKSVSTGDTLADLKAPVILESLDIPEPVIEVAIEPKTKADRDLLSQSLAKLTKEGPLVPRQGQRGDRPDPHTRAWANCTWKSSLTACCASSTSTPTWALPAWPTARPSPSLPSAT